MSTEFELALHPWNTGFEWVSSTTGPGQLLTQEQRNSFDEGGFVTLRSVLPPGLVEQVRNGTDVADASFRAELGAGGGRAGISELGAITFSAHLVARSDLLKALSKHPVFVSLVLDLIGPDVNLYWDQAVYKMPEKPRRFPWHQDNGYTFVEPQQYLTCWVPLVEATLDNGCPRVAPGLHRMGTLRHVWVDPLGWQCFNDPPVRPIAATAAPGDVIVFSSLTPHLTGPNLTSDARKAYILQYAPAGAKALRGDPAKGGPTDRLSCDNEDYQYPVTRAGRSVG
jgi:phytanoyl-CoA hydroxylase